VKHRDIWAVVPIKELEGAKQRLAPLLTPAQRRALIEVMMAEVLEAVVTVSGLAGVVVVTLDPQATALAERLGARVLTDGARDGHTGSVAAGLRMLAAEGRGGMLTLPADIPAVTPQEISLLLGAHLPSISSGGNSWPCCVPAAREMLSFISVPPRSLAPACRPAPRRPAPSSPTRSGCWRSAG
jgi:molybdopterin-guanine dinucleotide biosynthesis protein A